MESVTLTLWFSKCGSKLAAAAESGNLSTGQILRSLPRLPGSEPWGGGGGAGVVICLNGPLDSYVHLSLQ